MNKAEQSENTLILNKSFRLISYWAYLVEQLQNFACKTTTDISLVAIMKFMYTLGKSMEKYVVWKKFKFIVMWLRLT